MVRNGEIGRIIQKNNDGSGKDSQFDWQGVLQTLEESSAAGDAVIKYFDTRNTHPYSELEITEDATGKVTAAKPKIDGQPSDNVDFSAVGQILGSALGRALAPDNRFLASVAGTVVGAAGQKLAQAFSASLLTDGSKIGLGDVFADFDITLAGAGAGSVASFLTAEIGHALGLTGFNEQLFNASIGSAASGVANKIATEMLANGLSFEAAIGTINFASAATSAGYGVSSLLGGYLGRELVPAQTHEGAVGGQLLGAVGSAIALSASIALGLGAVLNFVMPGVGSLIGTIVGTLVGDALGSHPHPAAVDLIDQAGTLYGYTHSQVSASDGGDYTIPDKMAPAVVAIVNAYLSAVNGIAFDHSKQTQIGYVTNPDFRYINGWAPTHHYYSFVHADDAVHAAALDILQHVEMIGGDLLLKRAHANSPSSVPDPEPEWAGLTTPSEQSRAEKLVTMSADLRVAQDYANYLNNREAINALMAANPESAFTAGWIATFARVNDLGLNHTSSSDLLGGLVGFLDSVSKAGLGAMAANASVKYGVGGSPIVEVSVANGANVPGALSVFADQVGQRSDATATTVTFTFNGFGGNTVWYGGDGGNSFPGTAGHDTLIGGAGVDIIHGGNGFDFIDGGGLNDYLFGQDGNDILRGGTGPDQLYGDQGDDTYVFARGDGEDNITDEAFIHHSYTANEVALQILAYGHALDPNEAVDGGVDSLVFGPGINVSDVLVHFGGTTGADLTVEVRDPASPGGAPTNLITLGNWIDPKDRIETMVFADGTTLHIGAQLGAYQVPFGAALSGRTVAENSANASVVGKVTGFDLQPGAARTYWLLDNAGGRFAINDPWSGVVTVANGALLDYETASSYVITVRVDDLAGHVFDKSFTIGVIDVPNRAPVLSVPASNIKADPGQSLQVSSWFSAADADGDALAYYFADSSAAANSGHFVLNGTPIAAGTSFSVTAAQLSQLTFVAGAAGSSDDLTMQLWDGYAASASAALHISVNRAPVLSVPASNIKANPGHSLQVASLFSAADADGDALAYYFADNSGAANSGHFVLNGTPIAAGTSFSVTAAQLSQLTFVAGAAGSSDDLTMQLWDGYAASASAALHISVNRAPVLSVPASNIKANPGHSLQVASLFSAADADGDALAYYFADNSGAANSGHFVLNGTPIAAGTSFSVTAAQLAQLTFAAGAAGSSDDLTMQLWDGHAASASAALHISANQAPVLSVPASSITMNGGQSLQASTLFSATDADNDALTYYFADSGPANSGHFALNGTAYANGANFGVSAAQLANLTYVAGAKGIADDIAMQLWDGHAASAVGYVHVNVNVNRAPVLTVPAGAITATANQPLQVSSWFGAADADGDALTFYFADAGPANSGHFALNGTAYANGAGFGVSAAQLANLTFLPGAEGVSDDLAMQLWDGLAASAVGYIHVEGWHL